MRKLRNFVALILKIIALIFMWPLALASWAAGDGTSAREVLIVAGGVFLLIGWLACIPLIITYICFLVH